MQHEPKPQTGDKSYIYKRYIAILLGSIYHKKKQIDDILIEMNTPKTMCLQRLRLKTKDCELLRSRVCTDQELILLLDQELSYHLEDL